ncbi:hypothetical protein [Actinomadura rubrobrunea]|nr:hypothetical protein [Actinomadura rubrobrunea]
MRNNAPRGYEPFTRKPLVYLPVMLRGRHIGYLWAGMTGTAAGFIRRNEFLTEAFEAPMVWSERLAEAHAQGLHAREAIRRWIGAPEDPRGGAVPPDAREGHADDLAQLQALANPGEPPTPGPLIQDGEYPDGTPVDRSRGWGPLHFQLPPSYSPTAAGPVRYLPVVKDGLVLGYLWSSVAGGAASFLARRDAGVDGRNAIAAWTPRLRELHGQGVPATEMLRRCRAMASDPRAGAVPADAREEEAASLADLERLAATFEQSLRISFNPDPDDPAVARRPAVPAHERAALLDYLERAPVVHDAGDPLPDPYDPRRRPVVPNTFHTDGTWVWLGGVAHCLRVHGVPPEPDLVEHVRANRFRLPEVGRDARARARAALERQGVLVGPPPAARPTASEKKTERPRRIDPRDVRRTTEDLAFQQVGSTIDNYASNTTKPVRYLVVGGKRGVLGYLWAAEGEEAAGFVYRPDAGDDGPNEGVAWVIELRAAKARGVPASRLLEEFAKARLPVAPDADHLGRIIPGSEGRAPSLDALKAMAKQPPKDG